MALIVRVDVADLPQMQVFADVMNQGNTEDFGDLAQRRDARAYVTEAALLGQTCEFYLVYINRSQSDPVGAMSLVTRGDLDSGEVYIRILKPVQGYGFGQKAFEFAQQRLREMGCTRMLGTSSARTQRDTRNVRFLLRCGFSERLMLLRQDLSLDAVRDPGVRVDEVALRVVEGVPEFDDLGHLSAMSSSMQAELGQLAPQSYVELGPEELAHIYTSLAGAGRQVLFGLACDRAGELVAYTELQYGEGDARCEQLLTYVAPGWRHRGVATALKAHTLAWLARRDDRPPALRTFMPVENTTMAAINRRLGFVDTAYYREWEIPLV